MGDDYELEVGVIPALIDDAARRSVSGWTRSDGMTSEIFLLD